MFRRLALMLSAAVAALGIFLAAPAGAQPVGCTGNYSIGVGGFEIGLTTGAWDDSSYVIADQQISYDTLNPVQGYAQLDAAYWHHRALCPADDIQLVGHSEGAGLVHAWVTANQTVSRTSAVLIADPKRAAGPGAAGLASVPGAGLIGWPLAGADANFGTVPVLEVCNHDDGICNVSAGPVGYAFTGAHQRYSFYADDYPFGARGTWFN